MGPTAKGKHRAKVPAQSLQLRTGAMSTDVGDASFLELGFKVDAVISKKGSDEPSDMLQIKSIEGQGVTVKSTVGQDNTTTMKRCQIVDRYIVADTTDKSKAARLRVILLGLGCRVMAQGLGWGVWLVLGCRVRVHDLPWFMMVAAARLSSAPRTARSCSLRSTWAT